MITIPTGELTMLVANVLPMAWRDDDLPVLHSVRLQWDGDTLHAQAADHYRLGWSRWHPDDDPPEDTQGDLLTDWGGADDPWDVLIPHDDATHLAKMYKLGKDGWMVPLTLDRGDDGRLTVHRSRDTGYAELTTTIRPVQLGVGEAYPDLAKRLADNSTVKAVRTVALSPSRLADFAKVRPAAPMTLTFGGEGKLVQVAVGERFIGAIMPEREASAS